MVASVEDLRARGKVVVGGDEGDDDEPILVMWNEGEPVALADTCIHRERSLSEGFVFNGQIVCPGHQWSFDLRTGYCKVRERYQPSYDVHVDGDDVYVDIKPRSIAIPTGASND